MTILIAAFTLGQLIHHKIFGFRGVIIDVDAYYQGTDQWYATTQLNFPNKKQPWYHILVHGGIHQAYVAEEFIELDFNIEPIDHPDLDYYFTHFKNGIYNKRSREN
ncbi:MAG: Heat shock protein HspQ [Legionellaceae bacterium]